jgi:two-component system sensor histidine kinase/response regulator
VLVADQSYVSQRVAAKLLEVLNCTVEMASNGMQALNLIKENPTCYDIVLMDLNLPVMDGMECATQIRKEQGLGNIALVAFGSGSNLSRDQVLEMGFDGMVSKPATRHALRHELDVCLKNRSDLVLNTLSFEGSLASSMTRMDLSAIKKKTCDAPVVAEAGSSWRVLIVEDNAVCMRVAVKMMQKLGFVCETADNGLKAFNMLEEKGDRAHLVLMDLRMPVLDGLEATRKIRKELGLQSLKIVALTGELMDEKWASDFHGVLNKPATAESLRQEITRHLPDWQKPV